MFSQSVRSKPFSTPPSYLKIRATGINISDHSVKALTFKDASGSLIIKNYIHIPLPEGVVENGDIKKANILIRALQKLKKDLNTSFVRLSIPEEKAFIFTLSLPKLKYKEIQEAIELQLPDHVPVSNEQVIFDFDVVSSNDDHIDVSVTALPESVIRQYEMLLEEADLIPLSFEVEAQAISRSIISQTDMGTYMIVDMGRTRTGISIIEKQVLRYTSTLAIGGDMITQSIEHGLGKSYKEAEIIKQEIGFSRKDPLLYETLVNVMSAFKSEIITRLDYWEVRCKEEKNHAPIQGILICGGNAHMPNLIEYIGSQVGIKTEHANVWINAFETGEYVPDLSFAESLGYTSAIGLALSNEM